jgi:ClpP class serine protease
MKLVQEEGKMKATLSFDLPEEQEEYEIYQNAMKLHCAADAFSIYLRKKMKYSELTPTERKVFEEVQNEFYNAFEDII